MFGWYFRQLFVIGSMPCLRCLCVFSYSGVQHILSSSCVPFVASFSGLSSLIAPFSFSNVYWQTIIFRLPVTIVETINKSKFDIDTVSQWEENFVISNCNYVLLLKLCIWCYFVNPLDVYNFISSFVIVSWNVNL